MATAGRFSASSVRGHPELSTCSHIQMYIHVQYMDLKLYHFLSIVNFKDLSYMGITFCPLSMLDCVHKGITFCPLFG